MNILKINWNAKVADREFRAEVVFPSENRYEGIVCDPFLESGAIETDQEERLRWYFEEHLRSPYTDKEKARRAADSVVYYGESCLSRFFQMLMHWPNGGGWPTDWTISASRFFLRIASSRPYTGKP